MPRRRKAPKIARPPKDFEAEVEERVTEVEDTRVIERPDGFWVQPVTGGRERGPYASLEEALEQSRAADEEGLEPGNLLAEIEAELGLADWIDPDTSAPAEDSVPHIEEH